MTALPEGFVRLPLAHRALHDIADGRPENSRAAIRAAINFGYGIEIDVQMSSDGQAMVFHDYDLSRLTFAKGPVRLRSVADLCALTLRGDETQTIPTLPDVLDLVAGQIPVLIEIKDQDGAMGTDVGPLEAAVARALVDYQGDAAVMSFNPNSVAAFGQLAPDVPRGLTTSSYELADWPLNAATCKRLREIPDFDSVGATFISHEATDLDRPRVTTLRAAGVPVLCWTVRSAVQEAEVRQRADNITFEGYLAAFPS